jgi:hypothetical protein
MKKESWIIGETIHHGELTKVFENEDGYFIETTYKVKYIDINDYEIVYY